ncbi:MAG: glycosyltransferase family 4 protein [Neoaquamicrobium sediminum]|uniref:glycosyltransferase family 4 protein n=1 Tax=Neoaquamicrobium sediminum TaxID=1849104 RepID=UPI0040366906
MRILIVTDAWRPQINGVVRTLEKLGETLGEMGVEVEFLTPLGFHSIPMPSYPDIRLALALPGEVARRIDEVRPDSIHIATEGPLGFLARRVCLSRGIPFTTSYHTRFPEFLRARLPVPESWSYRWLRRFHNAGAGMMVATPSLGQELSERGFDNIRLWSRGVDTSLFSPDRRRDLGLPGPVFLNVGRVAVEKNLPAFLDLDLPGSKVVVGDGPALEVLKARYPDVHFLGVRTGDDLAAIYASADVFVFPSRTDTFGNVILEALASGCPVAAFPVTGPLDIASDGHEGVVVDEDLARAAMTALAVPRVAARAKAETYDWRECSQQFLRNLPAARHCLPVETLRLPASMTEGISR